MAGTETAYKRKLRVLIGGWSCAYETRSGGSFGYPDLQFLVDGVLLPVEVKVGKVEGDRLVSRQIRPSQIKWHHDFWVAGGKALILVCMGNVNEMDAWAVPSTRREVTSQWKQGWPVKDCLKIVEKGKPTTFWS